MFWLTNAATGNPIVKALAYIAAYALAEREQLAAANALGGGHSDLLDNIELRDYPGALPLPPEAGGGVVAADLRRRRARLAGAVMAVTQRPATLISLLSPTGPPAWTTIPSSCWSSPRPADPSPPCTRGRGPERQATTRYRSSGDSPKAVVVVDYAQIVCATVPIL